MSCLLVKKVIASDLDHNLKFLAIVLAEFADHDGSSIFPSVDRLRWATGLSESSVRGQMSALRKLSIIVPQENANGGRGKIPVYRMDVAKLPQRSPWQINQRERKKRVQNLDPIEKGPDSDLKGPDSDLKGPDSCEKGPEKHARNNEYQSEYQSETSQISCSQVAPASQSPAGASHSIELKSLEEPQQLELESESEAEIIAKERKAQAKRALELANKKRRALASKEVESLYELFYRQLGLESEAFGKPTVAHHTMAMARFRECGRIVRAQANGHGAGMSDEDWIKRSADLFENAVVRYCENPHIKRKTWSHLCSPDTFRAELAPKKARSL